jgi:hypothetical protein
MSHGVPGCNLVFVLSTKPAYKGLHWLLGTSVLINDDLCSEFAMLRRSPLFLETWLSDILIAVSFCMACLFYQFIVSDHLGYFSLCFAIQHSATMHILCVSPGTNVQIFLGYLPKRELAG